MPNFKILPLIAVVSLTGSMATDAQPSSVRLKKIPPGFSVIIGNMPALMAKELGYYHQEGFDTEIIVMRASVMVQALAAGRFKTK